MIEAFQNAPLDRPFKFKMSDFGIKDIEEGEGETYVDPLQSQLQTPGVNPAAFDTAVMQQGASGLTATETALLSEEEKGIKLRQRGMTA